MIMRGIRTGSARHRGVFGPPVLALAAAIAAATPPVPVMAQSAPDECAGMANAAEEIACLREALEQSRRAQGATTPGAERTRDIPTQPEAPLPQRQPRAAVETPSSQRELGAEQMAARNAERSAPQREAESIRARIASASAGPRGMLTFQLDNGQLWQQVDRTAVPVRIEEDKKYAVEITRSGFGGYRLRFADSGKIVAVRRLQ